MIYSVVSIIIPIIGSLRILKKYGIGVSKEAERIALIYSLIPLIITIIIITQKGKLETLYWTNSLVLLYNLDCDGLSLVFILLTSLITPIAILIANRKVEILVSIFIVETLLIGCFLVTDFIWFFVFFESVLIPIYFLIGGLGSGLIEIRVKAAYKLFLYTLAGSVFLLLAILIIYLEVGSTNLYLIRNLANYKIQLLVFPMIFIAFAVKIPLIPIHLWLPKAHVEAPTCGSIILAALLLKLGGYGLIKWLIPICPLASIYYSPLIIVITVLGVIYSALICLRQTDIKRIIAYSSVSHMAFVSFGIFSLKTLAIQGAVFQIFSHGLISCGLFICIGNLYERYHSRTLKYYRGLSQIIPIFCSIFFLYTLAKIGVPLNSSFVGEFLILIGCFHSYPILSIISLSAIIITGSYGIWLFNRICFGSVSPYIKNWKDLTRLELYAHLPIILLIWVLGIYPSLITDLLV